MKFSRLLQSLPLICLLWSPPGQAQTNPTYVCVETNKGNFCMQMMPEDAPNTVTNFLKYVNDGDYDSTFVHRTIPGFIIQGGGYKLDPLGEEVPQDPQILNEFRASNIRGTVAMAKFANQPDSASNEWFVNVGNNSGNLDFTNGGYTVFARIVNGMNVVDAIANSERVDLSTSLGGVFTEVPVLVKDPDGVGLEDLVQVTRVYVADPQDVVIDELTPSEQEAEAAARYACTAEWVESLAPRQACLLTNVGEICLDLYPEEAPLTVANFLHYVADGDYDLSFFHRSVPDFVVQGGGFVTKPLFYPVPTDAPVANEFSVSNTRGTVAMAKQDGNPDSATSQWFVNLKDNSSQLNTQNGGFTVFGSVTEEGMAIIDNIAALPIANLASSNSTSALGAVPLIRTGNPTGMSTADLVTITRAYIPGAGENPCLERKPEAFTEFTGGTFNMPVLFGDQLYHIYFRQESLTSQRVFFVERGRIVALKDVGQERAVYTPADGMMVIPSVLVNDTTVIRNVRLRLTDSDRLQFTVESFEF